MAWLSDAHDQWHQLNGKYAVCDLDCGRSEVVGNYFEADAEALRKVQAAGGRGIKCGNCKLHHTSVEAIKFCYEVKYDAQTWARIEAAAIKAMEEAGECEHGMNKLLCTGPNHW